MKLTDIGF